MADSKETRQYLAIKLRRFDRLCPITGYQEGAIKVGAFVVVQTDRGVEYGQIIALTHRVPGRLAKDVKLKKVIRYATAEDLAKAGALPQQEAAALEVANVKIKEHELPIRVIDVEYLFDTSRIVIYYKTDKENKIPNLRDLTRDLSASLKARIELQQVTPRGQARLLGGLGPCGRTLCCVAWLSKPRHVTVKMVKEQGLALSPTKTSGMCGRLMCCMEYEHNNDQTKGGQA